MTYARVNKGVTAGISTATFKWEPACGYEGVTKLRVKQAHGQQYRINGDAGTWTPVNNGIYHEIYNGASFTLNTLELRRTGLYVSGTQGFFVYAIEINDVLISD